MGSSDKIISVERKGAILVTVRSRGPFCIRCQLFIVVSASCKHKPLVQESGWLRLPASVPSLKLISSSFLSKCRQETLFGLNTIEFSKEQTTHIDGPCRLAYCSRAECGVNFLVVSVHQTCSSDPLEHLCCLTLFCLNKIDSSSTAMHRCEDGTCCVDKHRERTIFLVYIRWSLWETMSRNVGRLRCRSISSWNQRLSQIWNSIVNQYWSEELMSRWICQSVNEKKLSTAD